MRVTQVDLLLWLAGFISHIALFSVIWIRRHAHKFPVFTGLIALNIVRTVLLFVIERRRRPELYFYSFWFLAAVDALLQLGIVYEVASQVFRPLGKWARDIRKRLVIWVAASTAVALLLTAIPKPPSRFWIQVVILKGSFLCAALMSELFVGMIALSAIAGLAWPPLTVKVAKGLGVYSLTTLLFETANTCLGLAGQGTVYSLLARVRILLYLGCVAYWIYSFWTTTQRGQEMPEALRMQVSAIGETVRKRLAMLRAESEP
jgi:hypothetical protein